MPPSLENTKVPFETLPNSKYCTDVRIVSGRPFSVGPLIDSVVVRCIGVSGASVYPAYHIGLTTQEWHSDKPEYKKPLRFKGYQGPEHDGPMPRIEVPQRGSFDCARGSVVATQLVTMTTCRPSWTRTSPCHPKRAFTSGTSTIQAQPLLRCWCPVMI